MSNADDDYFFIFVRNFVKYAPIANPYSPQVAGTRQFYAARRTWII